MDWKDNLRQASFRGATFKVQSHNADVGRRVVIHEYPKRDVPYSEDMGLRARQYSVEAYVIGDDYFSKRDALMRACEAEGSAELVHPYLGTINVVCLSCSLRESSDEGRMARLSLQFIQAGENRFPGEAIDIVARAELLADAVRSVSVLSFADMFSISGLPGFVVSDARNMLANFSETMRRITNNSLSRNITEALNVLNGFNRELSALLGLPKALAKRIHGIFFALSTISASSREELNAVSVLYSFGGDAQPIPLTTSTRVAQQRNRDAITSFIKTSAVTEAARVAPTIDYLAIDDAEEVHSKIMEQLELIAESQETSDEVFSALQDLKTIIAEGVPQQNKRLPYLMTYTPHATVPSLVLAHRLYEDISRAQEIVDRNGIKHPGFIPGSVPLRVVAGEA